MLFFLADVVLLK